MFIKEHCEYWSSTSFKCKKEEVVLLSVLHHALFSTTHSRGNLMIIPPMVLHRAFVQNFWDSGSQVLSLLLLFICTIVSPVYTQTHSLDSLTSALHSGESMNRIDTGMVNLLNNLSVEIRPSNIEQSFRYAQRADELARKISYRNGVAMSEMNMGVALWKQGKLSEALDLYTKALKTYQETGNKKGITKALNNIGIVYDNRHQPDIAIRYYTDALKAAKETQDKGMQSFLLTNLGALHADTRQFDRALEYHLQGLKLKEELGDTKRLWSSVIGIAVVYGQLKRYEEALAYYQRGRELARNIGDKEGETMVLVNITDIYIALGKHDEAIKSAKAAVEIGKTEKFLIVQEGALRALSNALEAAGQDKQALAYYKQFAAVRDSLFSQENNDKIAKMYAEYETQKKEQQIKILEQSRKLDAFWLYGLILGVVFLTLVIVLLLNRYSLKRRSELILTEKNAALSEANTEILRQQETLMEQSHNIQLANTQLQETIVRLQYTNRELEEANAIKMKFVHLATKDLANFLAALNNASQFLHDDKEAMESKEQLTTLLQSTASMHAVMMDVLQTNVQLEKENEIKIKLLGLVAHDLRNPLTSILGLARLLLGGGLSKPNAGELVTMIIAASENMYRLINDLLDNTALQMGKLELHLRPMNLTELCTDMIEQYQSDAERKQQHLEVDFEPSCYIMGDWQRISQVIDNLLSNAIKYSPFDTKIIIRLYKLDTVIRLEVCDEGPGLTEDDKNKLFGFFQRLSARPTGGESSSGIGLASVKKIVELHNGYVRAESEFGDGTTFIVEIPVLEYIDEHSV